MKYTYEISFNGSDYTTITPGIPVSIEGFWEGDEYIDRYSVSELKITKSENPTVYDTLNTWSTDASKYATEIFYRINKDTVTWKEFVFGVRWGEFDKETGVFSVKPAPYDGYYKYIAPNWFKNITEFSQTYGNWIPNANIELHYDVYDYESTNKPYSSSLDPNTFATWQAYNLWDILETIINNKSIGVTLKSSLLNNDTSTVLACPVEAGIPLDYVTNK